MLSTKKHNLRSRHITDLFFYTNNVPLFKYLFLNWWALLQITGDEMYRIIFFYLIIDFWFYWNALSRYFWEMNVSWTEHLFPWSLIQLSFSALIVMRRIPPSCRLFCQVSSLYKLRLKPVFNPFPNKLWFLRVCRTSLLKTLWEKEKLLVTVFSTRFDNFLTF